jgi:CpeT protein
MLSGGFSEIMRCSSLLFACLLLVTGRALAGPTALERLTACMAGSFTTADQSRDDKNVRDITLHVVLIWIDRTDGPWLYSEQSLTDAPDHPYRQRIYQLTARPDGAVECRIFDLADPIAVTGGWKDPSLLARLSPASLGATEGCTMILRAQPDGAFKGGTEGKACLSILRGASYATTEITIDEGQTVSWDRGYNASDIQVWGSTRGGFIFKKQ